MPLIAAFIFFLCCFSSWACEAATIGVHLHSLHTDQKEQTNQNVGVYLRADSGFTAGFYRSSLSGAPSPRFPHLSPAAPELAQDGAIRLSSWAPIESPKDQPEHFIAYAGYTFKLAPLGDVGQIDLTAGILTGYRYSLLPYMPFVAPSVQLGYLRFTVLPASRARSGVVHLSAEVDF